MPIKNCVRCKQHQALVGSKLCRDCQEDHEQNNYIANVIEARHRLNNETQKTGKTIHNRDGNVGRKR